jgi:hypothetical protein
MIAAARLLLLNEPENGLFALPRGLHPCDGINQSSLETTVAIRLALTVTTAI